MDYYKRMLVTDEKPSVPTNCLRSLLMIPRRYSVTVSSARRGYGRNHRCDYMSVWKRDVAAGWSRGDRIIVLTLLVARRLIQCWCCGRIIYRIWVSVIRYTFRGINGKSLLYQSTIHVYIPFDTTQFKIVSIVGFGFPFRIHKPPK